MPEKKEKAQKNFRLSEGTLARLEMLADRLEIELPAVVDLALKHFYGSYLRDEGFHMSDPPPTVKAEGGPNDAA